MGRGQRPNLPPEDLYDYPWVGPNKKSMPIDLAEFKELDAYAQKVDVKDSLENLVSVLLQKAHSDLEKVRAIWVWICHHIEYDSEGCQNKQKLSLKPSDVLQSGKTICAGYALLFEKMCSIAGIPCECLVGRSKRLKKHAWNAVHLDGKWHLLDCTWGRCRDLGRCNDLYFLMHPALFVEDHFPDDPKWLLLKQRVKFVLAGFLIKRKIQN